MAPLAPPDQNRLVETIGQSPPVDLARPYDASTLRGRTILVTGGASGLGAAFARHWAAHGANLIIGDIDDAAGEALVAELRTTKGNDPGSSSSPGGGGGAAAGENNNNNNNHRHFFVHVDVTDWSSQAALFREAARLSPTGALDAVVASAGISDRHGAATGRGFENPAGLDAPDPPAPDLRCIQVNLVGVMYTAHLALFWLQQDGCRRSPDDDGADAKKGDDDNGGGSSSIGGGGSGGHDGGEEKKQEQKQKPKQKPKPEEEQARKERDRHLLLVGSYAGLSAIPGVPEYVTSKHGVTGLFRSLRTLSYRQGVRVNLLCPYFVDTPILGNQAMAMLAGMGLGAQADVVDAATRLMACCGGGGGAEEGAARIAGRALAVGPRLSLLKGKGEGEGKGKGKDVLPVHELDGEGPEGEDITARDGDVLVDEDVRRGKGQAVWECYAHDYDTVDFFIRRYIRVLNTVAAVRGWVGWATDLFHALFVRRDPAKSSRVG